MDLQSISKNKARYIIGFSVPTIISMVLVSLITVTDGFFIGNYVGSEGLAAVNLGLPAVYLNLAVGLMISVGGSTIAGIALGSGDKQRCKNVFNQTIVITFLASAATASLCFLLFSPMLTVLRADGNTAVYFRKYFTLMLFEYPLLVLSTSFGMFMRSDGKPQFSMLVNIVNVVLNGTLDFVFSKYLGWGITGIAAASIISAVISVLLGIFFFLKISSFYKFGRFVFNKDDIKNTFLNGSSEFIGEMASCIAMFCYNFVIMKYVGVDGVSAFTVAGYTIYIFSMVTIGFGQGMCPLVSFVYGGKDFKTASSLCKITNTFVFVTGIVFAAALLLANSWYSSLFVKSAAVQQMTEQGIRYLSVVFIITGFNVIGSMYFTSCGKALPSALISMARGIVILLVCIFTLPRIFGMTGVWLTSPAAEALTLVLTIILMKKYSSKAAAVSN